MPSFAITTFGCQMNVHDSERMREVLLAAGLVEASAEAGEHADVLVLNTCSVREKAEQKLRSEVGRVAKSKRTEPQVLVVAGCVAQQEGDKLLKSCKGIDLIIGPDNIVELPRLLDDLALGGPPTVRARFDLDAPSFLTASGAAPSGVTAFVTTMKGCDERCSFCIVPTTRGPERYRPSREIVAEIAGLALRGAREITLLGQTVNSYVDPSRALASPSERAGEESEFAALLREIPRAVPELRRLRYTSPHPRHLTPALVRAHAELDVLVRHVHLPVQSGSDRVLRRMIRRYDRAEYVTRVAALRAAVPGVTLSTDVIVGFPGETDDDFEATLSLAREIGFTALFGFKYSPRPRHARAPPRRRRARAREIGAARPALRRERGARRGPPRVARRHAARGADRGRRQARARPLVGAQRAERDRARRRRRRSRPHGRDRRRRDHVGQQALGRRPARRRRARGVPARDTRRATEGAGHAEEPPDGGRVAVALVYPFDGATPKLARGAWLAANATVIGDVELDEDVSVWFGAVVRGDIGPIRIGARTNVQDLACLHLTGGLSTTTVGCDVTIGHGAILHGCKVGDGCLVGMGSVLLDNCVIGEGSFIAARSLVTPNKIIPPGSFVVGAPARVLRKVTAEEARYGPEGAAHYVEAARKYRELRAIEVTDR